MYRDSSLVPGEVYHIFNRGAHKQNIFTCDWDYRRFLLVMYLANHSERFHLSNILSNKKYQGPSSLEIFEDIEIDRGLVDVLAYCLMPNHVHMVVRPKREGGLSLYMKKVLTAYSMYFNTKYEHSGVLFQGRFQSRLIDNEAYFRYIFAYVHLNALDFIEPKWKERDVQNVEKVRELMYGYKYSSFIDYVRSFARPERAVLSCESIPEFLTTQNDLDEVLKEFQRGRSSLEHVLN